MALISSPTLSLLSTSLVFVKNHFYTIFTLGLIAAFGRVIQLRGFGEIPSWFNIVLEVIIETSRILIVLFVIGWANVKTGLRRIKSFFSSRSTMKTYRKVAVQKMKGQWINILINCAAMLIIAAGINLLIDHIAYETCLFLSLKNRNILADGTSEWTILLFFKNITVIPLTLVFQTILTLWILNKPFHQSVEENRVAG
jgi:hypothetical protein